MRVTKNGTIASRSKMFIMFLAKSSFDGQEMKRRKNSPVNQTIVTVSTIKNPSLNQI